MARTDGKPENQHTVPRMLLRNFACQSGGKQPQLHVFDKQADRQFTASVGNIVAERGFYDFPGSDLSLEPWLAELEDKTSAAFQKLLSARQFGALNGVEAYWVATFVATQYLRAKHVREDVKALNEAVSARVKALGGDPDKVRGWRPLKTEDDLKAFALVFLGKVSRELAEALFRKRWVLFEAPAQDPFVLSDCPVVLHNDRDFGPWGNLGFKVPGIQVYLPLSPSLILGLWCPTHEATFREAARQGRASLESLNETFAKRTGRDAAVDRVVMREVLRTKVASLEHLEGMVRAIDDGTPTLCTGREVMFLNSLQVTYSERYVLSSQADFGLVKRMIADDGKYRSGLRMKI